MSRGSSRERPVVSPTREEAVRKAITSNSLEKLQELSLLPGGFGKARSQAWPYLLGVIPSKGIDTSISDIKDLTRHDQIADLSTSQTETLGSSASVNSETPPTCLPEDGYSSQKFSDVTDLSPHPDERQVQLDTDRSFVLYPVVESSLNQKKILQEDLHDIIIGVLRKRPALRYFQGYHDIVTVLFLTLPVELVLPSAEKLSLHRLRDSMGNGLEPLVGQLRILKRLLRMVDPPYAEILERSSPLPYYALSNLLTLFAHDVPTLPLIQHVFDWLLCREPVASIWLAAAVILSRKEDVLALEREGEEAFGMIHAVLSAVPPLSEDEILIQVPSNSANEIYEHTESRGPEENPSPISDVEISEESSPTVVDSPGHETNDNDLPQGSDLVTDSWTVNSSTTPPVAISLPEFNADFDSDETGDDDITPGPEGGSNIEIFENAQSLPQAQSQGHSRSTSFSVPGEYKEMPQASPTPLSTLLCHASQLLTAYPLSSPALRFTETFGPQSALRTSGLTVPDLFTSLPDDVAESFVGGDSVVLPMIQEEEDEELFHTQKPDKRNSDYKDMPNGWPIRMANGLVVRRQTVVAGVVLLLGVAVALYGFSPGVKCGRNCSANIGTSNLKLWVGGLLGLGGRLRGGF